ncbi:hypothetical protein NMG60_11020747 [Bertholletia excelsa]
MGCCGDEEEEILQPLHPASPMAENTYTQTAKTSASSSSAGAAVISPMNSNFAALVCRDVLRTIFEKLPLVDLARAACVCRIWCLVASDREMQTRAFKAPWKLKDVVGTLAPGASGEIIASDASRSHTGWFAGTLLLASLSSTLCRLWTLNA